jgi:hypothetical protein
MILTFSFWQHEFNHDHIKVIDTDTVVEKIVFYAQQEWEYTVFEYFEKLADFSSTRNIPFIIVLCTTKFSGPLHDVNDERYKNVELVYWKTFWLSTILTNMGTYQIEEAERYSYPFISLNNHAHYFRSLMMDTLAKHNLIGNAAISWHEIHNDYDYKYWTPEIKVLDARYRLSTGLQYFLPNEYPQAFMQLVAESSAVHHMMSEKTCVPLMFGKPFLVFGPMRFHKMLSVEYGFQLYDEIFDYSFDEVSDIDERCNMLIDTNVKRIYNLSNDELQALHRKILPKILYNQELARHLALDVENIPPFIKESFSDPGNIYCSRDVVNFITEQAKK